MADLESLQLGLNKSEHTAEELDVIREQLKCSVGELAEATQKRLNKLAEFLAKKTGDFLAGGVMRLCRIDGLRNKVFGFALMLQFLSMTSSLLAAEGAGDPSKAAAEKALSSSEPNIERMINTSNLPEDMSFIDGLNFNDLGPVQQPSEDITPVPLDNNMGDMGGVSKKGRWVGPKDSAKPNQGVGFGDPLPDVSVASDGDNQLFNLGDQAIKQPKSSGGTRLSNAGMQRDPLTGKWFMVNNNTGEIIKDK